MAETTYFESLEKLSEVAKAERERIESLLDHASVYALFVFHVHHDQTERRYKTVRVEMYENQSLKPIVDGEEFEFSNDLSLIDFIRNHKPIDYCGRVVCAIDFDSDIYGPAHLCLQAIEDRNRTNYRRRHNEVILGLSKLISSDEE